jgi:hypothetical protein
MVSFNEINQQAIQLTQLPAIPCDKDRNFFSLHTKPIPLQPADATDQNPWHPFNDHLAFDFANFQFAKLQASKSKINCALDLWMAVSLKAGGSSDIPWLSAEKMYTTIDAIQEGDALWIQIQWTQQIHQSGCWKYMSYAHRTCDIFYIYNSHQQVLKITLTVFHIVNLRLAAIIFGQT